MSALHLLLTLAIVTVAFSQVQCPPWTYTPGICSPPNWGTCCPDYAVCGNGKFQSPIEIVRTNTTTSQDAAHALKLDYQLGSGHTIQNDGHTLIVHIAQNGTMKLSGGPLPEAYELIQLHLHSKAEHVVDNEQADLVVHFVHQQNITGLEYAVVAITYKVTQGAERDSFIQTIDDETPLLREVNDTLHLPISFSWGDVMNQVNSRAYFHYKGSLTTPACTEAVQWFVIEQVVPITQRQLDAIRSVPVMVDNYRPVQPVFNRTILHWSPEEIIPRKKAPIGLVIGIIIGGLTCFVIMGIVVLMTTKVGKRSDYEEIEEKE